MDKELRILILEDVPADAELEEHELRKSGLAFTSKVVDTKEAFLKALDEFSPDLILSDYALPTFDGLEALRIAKEKCSDVPVIIISRKLGEEFAIETLKKGVTDYVLKDNLKRLVPSVQRALEEAKQIRDRKQAKEALRKSEERLRFHVENSPLAIVEWDSDYYVTRWSNEAERIFGWSAAQTIGKRIDSLNMIYEDDIPIVNRTMERLSSGAERTVVSSNRNYSKDGRVIECVWYNSVLVDEHGKMSSVMSQVLNITERKQAEEARKLHTAIMETVAEGIFLIGLKDNIIKWTNRKFEELFGYSPGEMVGMHVDKIKAPTEKTPTETRISIVDVLRQTGEWHGEIENIKKDGTYFWCYIHVSLFNHPEFGMVMVSAHTDITERKHLTDMINLRLDLLEYSGTHTLGELLQKTLDEIGALTDSPIGFYHFVEPDQKTLSLQAWSTRTEKEFCTAKGKGMHYGLDQAGVWVDCVHERKPVIHNDYLSLPHRKGLPEGHAAVIRELVVPIIREEKVVAILGIGNKPSDYTEKDVALVSFIADVAWQITKRKKAEEELKHLSDELKRSNEDLERFASAVSHDLQEPLRGIEGFIKLLEKRYKGRLDEKADEFIDYVVDDVKRMRMLIKDLLEYSRVSAKAKLIIPANCSVALEQALYNLRAAIDENGAVVTYDELPTVMGDDAQLIRLFQNLIGNAIKFRGKEPLKIHISANREGDEWTFSIRDNGIGIDPQQAERIFVIFQRLHSRHKYPGTGLGLTLCKRIVERHGGRIWVESEPEKGATFYFTIPERP